MDTRAEMERVRAERLEALAQHLACWERHARAAADQYDGPAGDIGAVIKYARIGLARARQITRASYWLARQSWSVEAHARELVRLGRFIARR